MLGPLGRRDAGRKGAGKVLDGVQRRDGWLRAEGSDFASGQEVELEKAAMADSEASAAREEDAQMVDGELGGS